jgi:hypothetical protein
LQGPIGLSGTNGAGFVTGAYLFLPSTAATPVGFTKIGTSSTTYRDTAGRSLVLSTSIFQKN